MAAQRNRCTPTTLRNFAFNSQMLCAMVVLTFVIVVLQSSLTIGKKIDSDNIQKLDEMIVTVEHALIKENGEEFQPRGTITIRSLKHKTGVFYQNDHLSREDLQVLKDMAQNDAYYRIRVPARFSTDVDEPQIYVSTYVNACALLQSKFTETIIVSIDHLGNIYGVGLRLPVSQCEDSRRFSDVPSYFNTTVQILQQTAGALPDTQTYVQRLEKEKAEEAAGKGKDNRSFLAKYWMYIVPVVIFMLMTSQQGGDQQGEGEGS